MTSFPTNGNTSPAAPPSGESTMTSFHANNKALLCRKQCIVTIEYQYEVGVALSEFEKLSPTCSIFSKDTVGHEKSLHWKTCPDLRKLYPLR